MPSSPSLARVARLVAYLDELGAMLDTRTGRAFLVLVWPLVVAGLGLPTGIAQAALEAWIGHPIAPGPCVP